MKRTFTLSLDEDSSHVSYWLYRGTELADDVGHPVVDGVYIWRPELGDDPPENVELTIEWEPRGPATEAQS
ncbi:MAG: hypothetical protein QOF02_661 [Blastocatellia bacterium]|jgi:hypothetical protein|nr:hypothetical protein [Blastocatellia bacterium]